MNIPCLKNRNSGKNSRVRYVAKKAALSFFTIFLGSFFLQTAGVISIDKLINPIAAAQSKKNPAVNIVTDSKKISPEAMRQIEALSEEKAARSPAQRKIDSQILYTIKMERGESIARGVPTLETGLKSDARGYIDVDISANVTDGLLDYLKTIKAEISAKFPEYHSITARVPMQEIESLAAMEDVIFIQPKLVSVTNRIEPSNKSVVTDAPRLISPKKIVPAKKSDKKSAPKTDSTKQPMSLDSRLKNVRDYLTKSLSDDFAPQTGSATSEADTTHRAALARTLSGANGTGIRIGVMSNGISTLAARQASGDLPATVTVITGQAGSGDEGTAMLELVYDLAPGAQLYFATGNGGPAQFATNIRSLRTAGCDIIVDDLSYLNETPFQNGQAATVISPGNAGAVIQAVNDVTAAGALYFSSAANSGNKNDNTAGAWEGDFVSAGAGTGILNGAGLIHNFGGGVTQNAITVAGRPYLKWSDPLGGSSNDYDMYILNAAGTTVVIGATNGQSGTQDPIESFAADRAVGERIVIALYSGANRFLHLNMNRGQITVSTPGVVYGHNAGLNTISVAATPSGPTTFDGRSIGPFPNAHSSTNTVESFSSDGPRRIFYNADGSAITPGNVSSTGGQLLQKPDITAADGSTTTTPTFIPFYGTSAAAPHAAALMALLKSASPASTNAQLYSAMTSSAIDIETAGVDRDSGFGIFMPLRAMAVRNVAGPAFLERNTPPTTSESVGNGNGRIEPNETANLNVPLSNLGLSDATNVSATLTTSTLGVTITSPRILSPQAKSYPTIVKAVGTETNTAPYQFSLASNFPCGGSINFTLTVNYTGGSSPSQVFNFTVETASPSNTATTLDATAPAATANYTTATGTQTGRLARTGVVSSCGTAKAAPGLTVTTGARRYDAYTYTAASSGCITVTLSAATNVLYSAAYNNSGFVPANPNTNFLADAGTSAPNVTYSFNVTAGQNFTVVVHEVDVNGGNGLNYTLNVSGPIAGGCSTFTPTAASVSIGGRVNLPQNFVTTQARVTLTDSQGNSRTTVTGKKGSFIFRDVPVDETYIIRVSAKGASYAPLVFTATSDLTELNFVPIEQSKH